DPPVPADDDATTGPAATGLGRSPEPAPADTEAPGEEIPRPDADDRTLDRTPGPTDTEVAIDRPEASPALPRGTTARYFGDYELRTNSVAAAWAWSTRPGSSASTGPSPSR